MLTLGLVAVLLIAYTIATATDDAAADREEEDRRLAALRNSGLV